MKIIFECDLDGWATEEEFAIMTDEQIEDLVREDLTAALDSSTVRVVRDR